MGACATTARRGITPTRVRLVARTGEGDWWTASPEVEAGWIREEGVGEEERRRRASGSSAVETGGGVAAAPRWPEITDGSASDASSGPASDKRGGGILYGG